MVNEQAFIRQLLTFSTEKTFEKDDYVLKEGQLENNVYFVVSGALRLFILSEFEEQTIRFGYKNSIITSLTSFYKNTASEFYIQAIRRTTLAVIPKKSFFELVYQQDNFKDAYLKLLESLITQQIEREIDLLTFSPTERLRRVLDRSPQLFQEIPLKYIASYLRMTPETLSRIRRY